MIVLILSFTLGACEEDPIREISDTSSIEEDQQLLEELYQEIVEMISGTLCEDASQWRFTAIGAKACGGAADYIAYPLSIDEDHFLNLVGHYTEQTGVFNTKWGVFSTCDVTRRPTAVACQDGEPFFLYK